MNGNRVRVSACFALVCLVAPPALAQLRQPAANAPATRPATGQTDVPVRQVVLFSSGVGYFEHFGAVKGNDSTELRFKTDQINDVLKSLVLQDLDKGQVSSVSYPSQEPLSKTLKSFQVDITANPPLADLLNQLRGARIDVTLADGNLKGTIVGVEKRKKVANDKGEVVESWLLNLKVGRKFRSIPIDALRDFELEDPRLEEELDKALSALAQARDQEKKPVTINFRGEGERRVRMGYVVETPIWKTSYRLVLTEAAGKKGNPATRPGAGAVPPPGEPGRPGPVPGAANVRGADPGGRLQGWAIVENQTDNDWDNVQLSLVSGRPISFIQDLYHPLYVPRPYVQPELYASLRPQTYSGGITNDEMERMERMRAGDFSDAPDFNLQANRGDRGGRGGGGGGGQGLFGNSNAAPRDTWRDNGPATQPMDPTASVASAASAARLGELFEYTVGNVTIARQKSAMIPIVTDDVEVEKLSIYNNMVLPKHPLNGARVKNTTKKHLLQGPVTVLEAGTYAGDARIEDLPPGQTRLLSYGIDLNVVVDPCDGKSDTTVQTGRIVKGVLEVTRKQVVEQTYVMQNKGDSGRTVIVEHPRSADWKLVEPAKAEETTDTLHRFRTQVDAGKTGRLKVQSEHIDVQQVAILTTEAGPLEEYVRTGEIPKAVRDAIAKAVQMKNAMAATQRQVEERKKQVADVSAEQARMRENMKTVAQNSDYYNRLLKKLDEQETQIEQLQKETATLQKQLEGQRQELEAYLGQLNVG